jgi:hypothetical protein
LIGDGPITGTVVIVEGFATGGTIHETTGLPVAVAFDCGNLKAVAMALRAEYPKAVIIIAGDDDVLTEKTRGFNPGKDAAKKAAEAVGGMELTPPFVQSDGFEATDWNDFAEIYGRDKTRDCFNHNVECWLRGQRSFDIPAYEWREVKDIPPRPFVYGHHLQRRLVSGTIGAGGGGKSSKELVEALAMATGRPLLGVRPKGLLRVAIWNGEDDLEEIARRITAACQYYQIKKEELGDRLYVQSGLAQGLIIASESKRAGYAIDAKVVNGVIEFLTREKIDVLMIDPLVASHAVEENNNMAINAVVKAWAQIASAANCAIELVHHTRKGNGGGEVSAEDARGASALVNGLRAVRALNTMSEEECKKSNVPPEKRLSYFRADDAKLNFAPRAAESTWFHIHNVSLANSADGYSGDSIGVVVSWQWTSAASALTAEELEDVLAAFNISGPWAESSQASNWAGKAIATALDIDLDDGGKGRERAKQLLADLIRNGTLTVVDGKNAKGRPQRQVTVTPRPDFAGPAKA